MLPGLTTMLPTDTPRPFWKSTVPSDAKPFSNVTSDRVPKSTAMPCNVNDVGSATTAPLYRLTLPLPVTDRDVVTRRPLPPIEMRPDGAYVPPPTPSTALISSFWIWLLCAEVYFSPT